MPSNQLECASLAWIVVICLTGACAKDVGVAPSAAASDVQIELDPGLKEIGEQSNEAWLVYALLKAKAMGETLERSDDYRIEVRSRDALAAYWDKERDPAGRDANAYLDTLVEVRRAGHLEEYVLANLARPGWTIPGDVLEKLDLEDFAAWSRAKLGGHKVETRASIERQGVAVTPLVAGSDLPSFNELTKDGTVLCDDFQRASDAYTAWRAQEAKLPGIPLAAGDRAEFLSALLWLQVSGATAGRDVTWVSKNAADLSFLVGFCEADRKQPRASVEPLETAVRLDPLVPMWRLELAQALTAVTRFDAAEREIQLAMAQTEDRCILGAAWRKKGYLEIERGKLDQAELSYRKSLDYDPGSEVALSELSFIVRERMGGTGTPSAPDTPPPSSVPRQKRCPGA